ncbi:hypothetical protein [Bordetella genomosp. 11]|uniref:Uncharacterized protein n=1 Tax=Bordetella genomosp. 11 TaxID=1416808 RepID=A0A261UFY3_9BORD|nr:hypothetical protein [Bordetella genomosp. 11]OZI60110.1 hypothetical protein CAL28_11625 [Bordetella genomosp. 11]
MLALLSFALCADLVPTAPAGADNRPSLWGLVIVAWAITCGVAGACAGDLVAAAWSAVAGV